MRASRLVAAALFAALSVGCAPTATVRPTTGDGGRAWQLHRVETEAISHFNLQGRAAGSGLGVRADLRWQQQTDGRFEIRLSGPFGAGAFAITGTPAQVEIRSKDGVETTKNPERWLQERAGWTFPIRKLRWWALGLPAPGSKAQTDFDEQGRLARLQQDGWTLDYLEYQDAQGYTLPRRFEAVNPQISLKLVIDRWDDLPPGR